MLESENFVFVLNACIFECRGGLCCGFLTAFLLTASDGFLLIEILVSKSKRRKKHEKMFHIFYCTMNAQQ